MSTSLKSIRKTIVAGNWKMNGSSQLTQELLTGYQKLVEIQPELTLIAFPPFVYLRQASQLLSHSSVGLGAQNMSEKTSGAFTGEVAADMLVDVGCKYVLLGHSERRHLYAESNELIADKWKVACENNLVPVVCVGETLAQREKGETEAVIRKQLQALFSKQAQQMQWENTIIAYEPVWAIGTGQSASPEQAQSVHQFIRQLFMTEHAEIAEKMCILYGGSVKAENATAFFRQEDIDGVLVGGASLTIESFSGICACSNSF